MMYVILLLDGQGKISWVKTELTVIPENLVKPGEVAFLIQALAIEVGQVPTRTEDTWGG